VHEKVTDRSGYGKCKNDQHREFFGKQVDDMSNGGAQGFTDTDLFYPLYRHKGYEAIQTETGDKDGDPCEYFK
jgi:hypothetical protein